MYRACPFALKVSLSASRHRSVVIDSNKPAVIEHSPGSDWGVPEYLAWATRTWNLVTSRAGGRGCVIPEDLLFRALLVPIV
jgi:hypothetical protein